MSDESGSAQAGNPDTGATGAGGAQAPASASSQLATGAPAAAPDTGAQQGQPTTERQPPQGAQPPANDSWIESSIKDPDIKGWLQSKGYDKADVEAVAKSYRNLERVFGADKAGRTVVIPGAEASEQERMEIFDRLGRPESPDKYEIPLPDDAPEEFAGWAKETFHKAGLTSDQARAVAEAWNAQVEENDRARAEQYDQAIAEQDRELRSTWGRSYDRNIALAQRAARSLIPADNQQDLAGKLDAMEQALGYRGLMEMMSGLGERLGEDQFVDGNFKTPESVRSQIQNLEANQDFMNRYMNGDQQAVATLTRLYKELADGGQ